MTKAFEDEFQTIDRILGSNCVTEKVDAFSLAWIKAERQMRRLFTHVVYQSPAFTRTDVDRLRTTLGENSGVYFRHFRAGLDRLLDRHVSQMVGNEYERLNNQIKKALQHRNKIFHGQLTLNALQSSELASMEAGIRSWCKNLSDGSLSYIGYDGFQRNSFQKSGRVEISAQVAHKIKSIEDYRRFLGELVLAQSGNSN